ncbi:MAG: prepilin-type N-terminal cleavage/methylation domain-containing protein [Candidatus Omnitrophica bacterium]|nr:prepilin-type N-terminal cleavage/methylation domain-containing protein [Candidatus Omnitrophota bacterium]
MKKNVLLYTKKRGVTLLEVIVSALLLAVIMLGLAAVFFSARRHLSRSEMWMTDAELGRYFLEPLQMQVRADQWRSNCISNSNYCVNQTLTMDTRNYSLNYVDVAVDANIGGIDTNLTRVKVNITCTNCNWSF